MNHQIYMTIAFLAAAALPGAAAAQADPVNVSNHATLVRFSNKISFGPPKPPQTGKDVERALARLAAFERRNEFKVARSEITQRLRSLPQIVTVH